MVSLFLKNILLSQLLTVIEIELFCGFGVRFGVRCSLCGLQASIFYKSIAGRYRPVSYPDGPITARYRFIIKKC